MSASCSRRAVVPALLMPLWLASAPLLAADTPADVVKGVYKLEARGIDLTGTKGKPQRAAYLTRSFQAVLASIDKRQDGTGDAVLDFDPILSTNGDAGASGLKVAVASESGDKATVIATFGRGKDRRSVGYDLLREGGAWRIDDIKGVPTAKEPEAWSVRKISDDDLAARAKPKS